MTPSEFRKSCALWCTGVSIVTSTGADDRDCGLTLNSVTSVSVDPPLMLICLDNVSRTLEAVKAKGAFCINILASNQKELSERFAQFNVDKFDGLRSTRGLLDVPILAGCLVAFECKVDAIYPGGDHQIIVGHLKNIIEGKGAAKPLMFINGEYE